MRHPAPPSTLRSRVLVTVVWLLVGAMGAIGIANCWFALDAPFELEIREGTSWLYLLAQDAGRSLYDPSQVAFLNMNHGPLDPLVKEWIHRCFPSLPASFVVRAFVALLPFGLVVLFRHASGKWVWGLAWGLGFYLLLLGFGPAQFLIGRSDPAALLLLAAMLAAGEQMRRAAAATSKSRPFFSGAVSGALGVAALLFNWRYAPAALGLIVAFGLEANGADNTRHGLLVVLFRYGTMAALVAIAIFAAVLVTQFHGDIASYFRHFFGIFTPSSGWGAQGRMPFDWFPTEVHDRYPLINLGGFAAVAAVSFQLWQRQERTITLLWLLMLVGLWLVTAWGFALNHGAGGIHYFAPFYLVAAYFVAARLNSTALSRALVGIIAALLVAGLPWTFTWRQSQQLRAADRAGQAFLHELRQTTQGATVYSEDLHLFKKQYAGEVADVGDTVAQVATAAYFPPEFSALVRRHDAALEQHPPDFVVVGALSVVSPTLRRLVRDRYVPVAKSGPLILAQGLPVTLYRFRHP